ncbi:hypothetical protein [Massilia pseudoviolaceinigra]|uniref:hypothetical protein n=1 Tax=Massilia pseudoviolaceinigra TaxID=3057165 RepID=UPI0027963D05|nr:hypothetical protein [Massilia sp. CCM 9206]MDQ1923210.1 hypothetical protein [Massilia sp. CCM 9206]
MSFPNWAPPEIIEYLTELSDYRRLGVLSEDEAAITLRFHEMWTRLITRTEMELVWRFIIGLDNQVICTLRTNGGLIATVNRAMRNYEENPKFTQRGYKEEMQEIARLADILARKLSKFSNAGASYNPFPLHSLLDSEQIERARLMMHPDILSRRRTLAPFSLTYYLPAIDKQLTRLSKNAIEEAVQQSNKLRLPRKVNDKNTFRTYFTKVIVDFFFITYADYSPSRIAIFCSVALDDPDITPNLVGKIFPLGNEEKEMLKLNKAQPED